MHQASSVLRGQLSCLVPATTDLDAKRGAARGQACTTASRSPSMGQSAAGAEGIAITWFPSVPWLGGFVYRRPKRVARRRDRREAPKDLDARDLPAVVIGDVIVVLNPT
jgi:hypothetical protein